MLTMFRRRKRNRFKQQLEAAIANLDRERRSAINRLPDDIILRWLESGYQHTGNKVQHTIDLLSTSALQHPYLSKD
jgi:hypothetical protein